MTATAQLEIETPTDEPVIRTRRFVKAPPERVFDAWTNPQHIRTSRRPSPDPPGPSAAPREPVARSARRV
jgi:hypothetical protein